MNQALICEILAGLPHFRRLDPDLLSRIASCSQLVGLKSTEILFHEGDPCEAFYVVHKGIVQLHRTDAEGRRHVVHHLAAGRTFAEAAVLTMKVYPATAMALITPTEVIRVGGKCLVEMFRSESRLATAMVGSLCVWLAELVERVDELSVASSAARLARYLLRLPAAGPPDRLLVSLPLPKKDLAAHLATTPENLSRLLRRWQDAGWIESRPRAVVLLDVARLVAVADGEEH